MISLATVAAAAVLALPNGASIRYDAQTVCTGSDPMGACVLYAEPSVVRFPAGYLHAADPEHSEIHGDSLAAHELGHVVDLTLARPGDRNAWARRALGWHGPISAEQWNAGAVPPRERFAESYADCAMPDLQAGRYGWRMNVYGPHFRAVCRFFRHLLARQQPCGQTTAPCPTGRWGEGRWTAARPRP